MKTKVVVFDFDGTLTISRQNGWARVWQELNALELDEKYYNMYHNHQIDYHEWLNLCFEAYRSLGVTKTLLKNIAGKLRLIDGAEDVLKTLKENNILVYILSGGLSYIIQEVLGDLKKYIKEISATMFTFSGDNLKGYIYEKFNPQNKQEFIRHIIDVEKIDPKELLFVGNGKNDESAYLAGVNTLCLNADDTDPNNKTIWHNSLETSNLKDILKFII